MSTYVGQNFGGVLRGMEEKHKFQLSDKNRDMYVKLEEDRVIGEIEAKAEPCVGCNEVLDELFTGGKPQYTMAVVSSSALRRVEASLKKAGQTEYFSDRVFSAATSLIPPTSKPNPRIYIHAMDKLSVKPEECIAVEDSVSGMRAAVDAGIYTIGYIGCYLDTHRADDDKTAKDQQSCKLYWKYATVRYVDSWLSATDKRSVAI
ncbi:hypothetical protein HWV62_29292 [Athelia sp. TMB]|nr:hypothetical protein HWV62_29292 [Athelia sp. TMB]